MEDFGHNFITRDVKIKVLNEHVTFKLTNIYAYVCKNCGLFVFKEKGEDFYYFPIIPYGFKINLNITCNEYLIKKLLE